MKKKGSGRLSVIWVIAAVAIRIAYVVLGSQTITDPFGFFSHAMIQEQEREPLLTSGIAYAYTERLSDILQFIGNRTEPIKTYQNILLILWLILFYFAVKMLIGNTAALVSGTLLVLWPWGALDAEAAVECENYLMLYWALMLLLLGIFKSRVKESGWNRSNFSELYLMLTGFGIGIVIAWNYMGLLLIPVIIYVLACNHAVTKERIWLQDWSAAVVESKRQMSLISQGFILFAGALLGVYATLMKYTGLAGYVLFEQIFWWLEQFHDFPERCQDISGELFFVIAAAVATGCICQRFVGRIQRKMASRQAFRDAREQEKVREEEEKAEEILPEEQPEEPAEETAWNEEDSAAEEGGWNEETVAADEAGPDEESTAEEEFDWDDELTLSDESDWDEEIIEKEEVIIEEVIVKEEAEEEVKEIKFIENPLPLPPKPEIKEMDFDHEFEDDKEQVIGDLDFDFDLDIGGQDDFDH